MAAVSARRDLPNWLYASEREATERRASAGASLMQIFRATLSKAVSESELREAWRQMGFADVVAWNFDDLVVEARIERAMPWAPANFKQTFSMAIHRVCSTYAVTWL